MSLQGQVALVTGGANGIGLRTVKELLREGANVTVCDLAEAGEEVVKKLQDEYGANRALFVQGDVRDDAQFEAAFTKTKSHFGKLNILVNNAGLVNDLNWNLSVDVNLKGTIRGTLLAWKHMGKHEGGSGGVVVNVASIAGLMGIHVIPIYSATKHAVIGLTRSCGDEYHFNRTGVRIITVCPGMTKTTIFKGIKLLSEDLQEEFLKVADIFPSQKVDNVAKAIVELINNGSSGSVWVSEADEPAYQLDIPEYSTLRLAQ